MTFAVELDARLHFQLVHLVGVGKREIAGKVKKFAHIYHILV
jgi:hypothetical protein